MKKDRIFKAMVLLFALFAVFSFIAPAQGAENAADPPGEQAAISSIIIKLKAGVTPEQRAELIARNGGTEAYGIPALRMYVIEVPSSDVEEALLRYKADPLIESAELNIKRKVEAIPSDLYYTTEQWALSKIGWESVFPNITPAGTSKVAVLDTGVDASHPELQGRVLDGMSVFDNSKGLTDPHGHGTWLSGIVASNTDNGDGIAGVAFSGVNIMPVTVIGPDGTGQDSDIIQGVIWAADNGADVILMGFSNPGFSGLLQEAIDYAWSKGAVLIASTGNEGLNQATFPAGHRGVIGVSATDVDDNLASFSNYGEAVFLAAPGEAAATDLENGYIVISGTSASSAIVAGVAAFMKAVDPTLTNGIIVGRLARTADPAGTQEQTGNGRVNMARALADTSMDEIQPAGAPEGGPYVGPYMIAARNWTLTFAGTGSGSVTISVNTGTINAPTSCGGTGTATTSQTVTSTCSPNITTSTNNAVVTFNASPNIGSTFAGWSNQYDLSSSNCTGTTNPCSAVLGPSATLTVTFTSTSKMNTSLSVVDATGTYGGTVNLSATLTSGGSPVSGKTINFTLNGASAGSATTNTSGVATLTGVSLGTIVAGTYPTGVGASFAGDASYNPSSGTATLTVNKANQTITVTTHAPATTAYNSTFNVAATASSGLGVAITTSGVCSGSGTGSAVITMTSGTGTCTVHYNQSGNDNYNAAPEVTSDTTATKIDQTITVGALADKTYGDAPFTVSATASSGLTVSFSSQTPSTCSVSGNTVTIVAAGTCTIRASQAGNENYNAAPDVDQSFTINKANQTITFGALADKTYGDAPFTVSATASSGLTVSFSSQTPSTCSVSGNTVTIVAAGTCTIRASQAGNENYNAAPDVDQSFTINKAAATITLNNLTHTYDGTPKSATATTDPIGLSVVTITYEGSTTPPINAGSYAVVASLNNPNYEAPDATGTLVINKASSTTTLYGTGTFTFNGNPHAASATVTGAGGLNESVSVAYSGNCSSAPVYVADSPCTVTATYAGGSNHYGSSATGTITITTASTISTVTVTPNPIQQYSDRVTFTATLSPTSINGNAPATGVTFYVGTQNMGSCNLAVDNGSLTCQLANVPLLEPTPYGTAPTGQMAPGSRTVTAVFSGINPNFAVNDATTTLTINREDARAEYIGDTFVSTGSATSSTATVLLAATIRDITAVNSVSDPDAGDIRNARVTFVIRGTSSSTQIPGCTNLPVGLVNPSDTKTGTVSCNWSVNIGSSDSVDYTIGIIVNNYYERDSSDDNTVVTVSKSMNNFITGGGYITISNSSGICPATTGSKTNFGFNVKYNKSLTNLQGNMNIIIRSATSCTPGYSGPRVYQIKANAMNNLTVNSTNGTATFTSKANITDVTDPYNPISLFGNGTLRVTMDDNGEPGRNDTIGITFHNSSGGLWFSSNWDGTKTVEQTLGGGNLVVR